MSGPIDYSIEFQLVRLLAIQAALAAQRRQRLAATEERLALAREAAQLRLRQIQASRSAALAQHLTRQREQTARELQQREEQRQREKKRRDQTMAEAQAQQTQQAALSAVKEELNTLTSQYGPNAEIQALIAHASHAPPEQAQKDLARARELIAKAEGEQAKSMAAAETAMTELAAMRQELGNHEPVRQLRGEGLAIWSQRVDELLAGFANGNVNAPKALADSSSLSKEGRALITYAEELHAKFETRNALLRDVIDSLKAVGFFVSDPVYENPQDPESPVIVTASRGAQKMQASVDLSESINSVWDGFEGDHCKAAFFEYVSKLGERGVKVKTTLASPEPILKRQGAKDLPGGKKARGT